MSKKINKIKIGNAELNFSSKLKYDSFVRSIDNGDVTIEIIKEKAVKPPKKVIVNPPKRVEPDNK